MSDREIIAAFADARRTQQALKQLPGPVPALDHAFDLQCAITRELGWTQIGWKIGCTSEKAQKALNSPGPFPGTMFSNRIFKSGDHVPTIASNKRVVEPEVAFTMARDLPPRGDAYSVAEVLGAVASVHAAIEIVNPRTPKGFGEDVPWFVVDGGLNDSIVLGPPVKPLPRDDYAALKVAVKRNGQNSEGGIGANAMGGGELALTWLANHLNGKTMGLWEGDIVTTGVIAQFFMADPGDHIAADFEHLGAISLTF
jgi:2-keto-4-pentenoate hydratase